MESMLCKNGHERNELNSYTYPKTGRKICRICHKNTERNRINNNQELINKNRERVKIWREANPEKAREVRKNWLAKLKSIISEVKDSGCLKCGEHNHSCLDFHHRDPTKKSFNIGMSLGSYSIKRLMKELGKTIVLCSNCHRKLHYNERQSESLNNQERG